MAFLISCQKDQDPFEINRTINVGLMKNDLYIYNTQMSGDEEGGSIEKQAMHYQISEMARDSEARIIYRYQPEENYVGGDTVQIKLSSGSDGASPSTRIELITFVFEIN